MESGKLEAMNDWSDSIIIKMEQTKALIWRATLKKYSMNPIDSSKLIDYLNGNKSSHI